MSQDESPGRWKLHAVGLGLALGIFFGSFVGWNTGVIWVPVKRGAKVPTVISGGTTAGAEWENCRFALRVQGTRKCVQNFSELSLWIPKWQLPAERFREWLSVQVRASDSMAIFRRLILDESCEREWVEFERLLGWVHVYSAAGVHLDVFHRFFGTGAQWSWLLVGTRLFPRSARAAQLWRVAGELLRFWALLGLWILSGFRWGLLRPLIGLELGRAFEDRRLDLPFRGFKLLLSLGLDAFLAIESESRLASGFSHYASAVAGGILGWVAYCHFRKPKRSDWEGHLWLAVGSWLLPVWFESGGRERFPVALATPLLSVLSIFALSYLYLPGLLLVSGLALLGGPIQATQACLIWNHWANSLFQIASRLLLQVPQLGSLAPGALWLGLGGALLLRLVRRVFPGMRVRVAILLLVVGIVFAVRGARGLQEFERVGWRTGTSEKSAATVVQLDVGQGDAAWLRFTRGAKGFWDVGSERAWSPVRWIRFGMREGLTHIDFVGLSHFDEDHAGGVRRLLRLISLRCIAFSEDAERFDPRAQKLLNWIEVEVPEGSRPQFRSLEECFPGEAVPGRAPVPHGSGRGHSLKPNSIMSAAWVPLVGGGAWISLGDSDRAHERSLQRWLQTKRSEAPGQRGPFILKLSHHGSRTSTDPRLLEILSPSVAWISAGRRNHFGHPSPQVLRLLAEEKVPWKWTAREGNLVGGCVVSDLGAEPSFSQKMSIFLRKSPDFVNCQGRPSER